MAEDDNNNSAADGWKQKYYASLEKLERREREWSRVENVLRTGISRMSVALAGLDDELDRQLEQLRQRVRVRDNAEQLTALTESITESVERLERSGKSTAAEPSPSRWWPWSGRQAKTSSPDALSLAAQAFIGLIGQLRLPEKFQLDLKPFGARLRGLSTEHELTRLSRELSGLLNEACGTAPGNFSLNEALLQLLERLELPSDSAPQIQTIQTRLEGDVAEHEWPGLLEELAGLIAAQRVKAQREQKEVEDFFTQLGARLQELDDVLQSMESERVDSLGSGRELEVAVQKQVHGIRTDVKDAGDVGALKQLIQERLDDITVHVVSFRRQEEVRNESAEQRIGLLNARLRELEQETGELRTRINQERKLALIDALTGVYNRMAYEERVQQEYARWKRFREPLSLVILDIDNFKRINDTYGHMAGDRVLSTIAKLLSTKIRETDFLARFGGEEFVILMPGAAPDAAIAVAEKLRKEVEACGFHYRGDSVSITISCGIAGFRDSDRPEQVFERADAALYRAKGAGRNRCLVADAP